MDAEQHVHRMARPPTLPNSAFWRGKLVCVTGGTGFLGYHLVQQLLGLGARVRVFALQPPLSHPLLQLMETEPIFGDILDGPLVQQALRRCDVVFHTAAVVATWGRALRRMHQIHEEGTRNVLRGTPERACIVHTSSIVCVGAATTPIELTEDSPFTLDNVRVDYVHAKRAAERLALDAAAAGQHVVVVNPGYLVGPEDVEPSAMGKVCLRFWKGRMPFAGSGGFSFADVRDVATGHLLAAEHGVSGRRYILGGENRTMTEFLRMLAQAAGWRPRLLFRLPRWLLRGIAALAACRSWLTGREPFPSFQQLRVNRYFWYTSALRAEAELGFRARPLATTLADTYAWYRDAHAPRLRRLMRWWMRPSLAA
jgi:dihydroflavonol-4-reductase